MTKQRKESLPPGEWRRRYEVAARAAQRAYCDLFQLWSACRYKPCRRNRRCSGRARACLKRGLDQVPYKAWDEASLRLQATIPANADEATLLARGSGPFHLVSYGPE